MASESIKSPLIVIIGPTASGKTSLSIKLAKKFNGEVISADSRAIYKGMDIGTAKPTIDEQDGVPHWGIDLVAPDDNFTVSDFKDYANEKINEIRLRDKVPFLVGGTGLYIDAVIFDYEFKSKADIELRKKLQQLDLNSLVDTCNNMGIDLPENNKNKRYIIRAIENGGVNKARSLKPITDTIVVGISSEKDVLVGRIKQRTEQLFDDGVVEEAKILGERYGWESEAMKSNIYPLVHDYIGGKLDLQTLKDKFNTKDWRLAKRQLTWFRRNPYIEWLSLSDAEAHLTNILASLK